MTQIGNTDGIFQMISIHTPAKGVTKRFNLFKNNIFISIHTPAKGVTEGQREIAAELGISIHTPAKGVTRSVCETLKTSRYFNPHSREGSDRKDNYYANH
ncbi:hypothetical protein CLONEX_01346 [[Clostridium] nexile DSM 1787]|nr:hypothetical protein CLONEX_01346 [[Clostridium] nexile DSM 1787]